MPEKIKSKINGLDNIYDENEETFEMSKTEEAANTIVESRMFLKRFTILLKARTSA